MSDDKMTANESQGTCSAFWPFLLVAGALLLLLVTQVYISVKQYNSLSGQFDEREKLVQQSQNVQGKLKQLADGVIQLANGGDSDAKALVQKYGIQVQK